MADQAAANAEERALDALTKDFVAHDFDLRQLMRTIANSRTYQESISTNEWNEQDTENFSHAAPRRLRAEELMDALAQASAQAISNIKFDKVVVWEGGGANGDQSKTAAFLRDMARVMPPMMQVMKDIGGVEVPEYLAKLTGDTPTDGKAAHANGTAAAEAN